MEPNKRPHLILSWHDPNGPFYCAKCTKLIANVNTRLRYSLARIAGALFWFGMWVGAPIVATYNTITDGFGWYRTFLIIFPPYALYCTIRNGVNLDDLNAPSCPTCRSKVYQCIPTAIDTRLFRWTLVIVAGLITGMLAASPLQFHFYIPLFIAIAITLYVITVILLRSYISGFWHWFLLFGPSAVFGVLLVARGQLITWKPASLAVDLLQFFLISALFGPFLGIATSIITAIASQLRPTSIPQDATTCPRCAYDLTNLTTPRCPECGMDFSLLATVPQENAWYPGCHKHETAATQETNEDSAPPAPQPKADPQ